MESKYSETGAALPPFGGAPWGDGGGLAVIAGGRADPGDARWTYDGLAERAERLARTLCAQGLRPGQLVAVPESPPEQVILMQHALARAGAALLPLPCAAEPAAAGALLGVAGVEWTWSGGIGDAGRLHPVAGPQRLTEDRHWPSPLALVVATSGSTGSPRAVMLTQANLLAAAALSNRHLGLAPGDCWLCCLPLRHIGGLSIAYRCALAGATVLVHPGFDAAAVAVDLGRRGVTHLSLVPPMLARLLDLGIAVAPSLRVVLVGGQSLDPALAGRAIAAGWPLHVTYGMTETASQVATSGRLTAVPEPGVVGRPLPGLEVAGVAPGGAGTPLRVRGPVVMAGYANPGRRPGLGLEGGWFTTADLASRGADGSLCILGRADEVLVTGGVKVHPGRVESLLAAAPRVGRVAVVGVADPVWGERLVALYTGEASPKSLDLWCREHLAGPERPRVFRPRSELPLLASGKVDRRALRALAAGP